MKIKEEKHKIYDLDRHDVILTEKICFIKDMIEQFEFKRHRDSATITPAQKEFLDEGIRNMSCEIRDTMEEKSRAENERVHMYKFLSTEVKELERRNWETIQLLREIDSFLLRFYSAKLRDPRNSLKKREKERAERSAIITFKEHNDLDERTFPTEVKLEPVFVEKRKHFEIGMVVTDEYSVVMNDEFLGLKNTLVRICILADK